jgi:hypothetical protein
MKIGKPKCIFKLSGEVRGNVLVHRVLKLSVAASAEIRYIINSNIK